MSERIETSPRVNRDNMESLLLCKDASFDTLSVNARKNEAIDKMKKKPENKAIIKLFMGVFLFIYVSLYALLSGNNSGKL